MDADKRAVDAQDEAITPVLERNIAALLARHCSEEKQKTTQDRVTDTIIQFTGSMKFVYLHVVLFGTWIIINLGVTPLPRVDPSFVILAMIASVEAISLSTSVLISQNRMAVLNDKRADLDLQISLRPSMRSLKCSTWSYRWWFSIASMSKRISWRTLHHRSAVISLVCTVTPRVLHNVWIKFNRVLCSYVEVRGGKHEGKQRHAAPVRERYAGRRSRYP